MMTSRPTNAALIIARLRGRRPPAMDQELWDHFVFITNEEREASLPWETTEEALGALPTIYTSTMARLRSRGFDNQGRHPTNARPIPSKYHKPPFPHQPRPAALGHFPEKNYKLRNKGKVEKYGNARKNGGMGKKGGKMGNGACAKKLAQAYESNLFWVEMYEELEEWETVGWGNLRGKGKRAKKDTY